MNFAVSTIEKIDEKFDFSHINQYIKSIQFSLNGFSYLITDPDSRKHIALRSYDFGTEVSLQRAADIIQHIFTDDDLLAASNQQLLVAYVNRPWAMVPEMLYLQEKVEYLLNANYKPDEFSFVTKTNVPGTDLMIASRIPQIIEQTFQQQAENVVFIPHQAAFIHNGLRTLRFNTSDSAFFMNVNANFFDLLYIQNNQVQFYNNFMYRQYADVLYYTLATMEKLGLNPAEMHIFLQGNELVREIIPYEMKKHIRYIYLDKNLYGETCSHHFDTLPLFKYKLLTGIFACGS